MHPPTHARVLTYVLTHTHTHARAQKYAILMAFPLQQWARERTSVVRYTHKTGPVLHREVLQVCATYVLARVVSYITE